MKRDPRNILQQYKLKNTPVRVSVLEVLLGSRVALSHNDITERLKGKDIDKVTLYRTLNSFTEKGLTHKVPTEDRNWLYAIFDEDLLRPATDHYHAHFVCNKCDKIYCLPVEEHQSMQNSSIKMGFKVLSSEVRLHGLCPVCQ
ncbi:MAG: transcriptional repressor [Rhodothermaceae bacterium]|nr:transcriptional repressor [Rhodothermaceae bacterium]